MSLTDKVTGRIKKAAGDSPTTPRCAAKAATRSARARRRKSSPTPSEKADRKAEEVADLERKT